jgi:flagella basal body P-ring formation protein FlgA
VIKLVKRIILYAALVGVGCRCAHAAPVAVELRGESVVADAYFTVGDIASVTGTDEALTRALRELRVGHSPRAAGALTLKRAEVERALLRLRPGLRGVLELGGADSAVVRRGPLQTVEFARVREAAHEALQRALAERYARFELEPLGGEGRAVSVPHGRLELHARLPGLAPAPGRVTAWVDVEVDGRSYQAIPASFELRAYAPALFARRALAPGAALAPADFEPREAQVAGQAAPLVDAGAELGALRLKRPLAPGAALTARHVQRAPAVRRDQDVRVQAELGGVAVQTVAVALKDGAAGEVIRVRNPASNQTYAARVTGAGTVEALWR